MIRRTGVACAATALVASLTITATAAATNLGAPGRVSVSEAGTEGDGDSYAPSLSADGRYVAFESAASNLVAGDTNGVPDVFVRDLQTGSTQRVSVGTDGAQADDMSWQPTLSADGRTVAFLSRATTLGGDAQPPGGGIFVRDLDAQTTRRLPLQMDGASVPVGDPALSGDGRYVAFTTPANLVPRDDNAKDAADVYRIDVRTGKTRLVSVDLVDGKTPLWNQYPSLSFSGRYVAFQSAARLVDADHNNNRDIYVRDMTKRAPRRVSVSSHEEQATSGSWRPTISATGRYVVFISLAPDLVRRDTNDTWDVFVRDRGQGITRRVSLGPGSRQADRISSFWERAAISRDGRYVAFTSAATNLLEEQTTRQKLVFLRDRALRRTTLVSAAADQTPGNGSSGDAALSSDGSTVAFASDADNLAPDDAAEMTDVFVRRTG